MKTYLKTKAKRKKILIFTTPMQRYSTTYYGFWGKKLQKAHIIITHSEWHLPKRNTTTQAYRFGFNGKEKDDEVKGSGNSYDFWDRMYDSRLGRWLSLDPLAAKYPNSSAYVFVLNTPLIAIDPSGRDVDLGNLYERNDKG